MDGWDFANEKTPEKYEDLPIPDKDMEDLSGTDEDIDVHNHRATKRGFSFIQPKRGFSFVSKIVPTKTLGNH